MKMIILEKATAEEAAICYEIIDSGRQFQRQQGFVQWADDYPSPETIRNDIQNQKGYILRIDGKIAGYMYIDFDGEPAYENIKGEWRSYESYAVVHRMAFSPEYRRTGLSSAAWELIEKLCLSRDIHYIRADTDFKNKRMQHVLEKNGFKKCGIIFFVDSEEFAYDKLLK